MMGALLRVAMALDPNARKISIGFPGGSLTSTLGLLKAVFGDDLVESSQYGEATISVKAHSRVNVIGGPSTPVGATNFVKKKYPTGQRGGAAAGEAIQFFYEGDWWTARLAGSHQDLNDWLTTQPGNMSGSLLWRSEKGTPYGPFVASAPVL
jgi:hypothetical protein